MCAQCLFQKCYIKQQQRAIFRPHVRLFGLGRDHAVTRRVFLPHKYLFTKQSLQVDSRQDIHPPTVLVQVAGPLHINAPVQHDPAVHQPRHQQVI